MDRPAAVKLIRDTFENSFDKGRFTNLSKNLVKHLDDSGNFSLHGNYIPDAYDQSIRSYDRVGKYEDSDGNKIDILTVRLKKERSLERARTMQRNFVAWYLNGSRGGELKDAALVAFVSPDDRDWRFSLVRMDYNLVESPTGRVKVEKELTPARRYSFLVGESESSHTAQVQLLPILEDDERKPLLSDLEKAFSIEVVTREFFKKYRELFHNVDEALQGIIKKDARVKEDFAAKDVDTVNFSKKLLGQIVFLYFLQKKGWFGVGRDEDWGTGPKDFLRRLFEKKIVLYGNFFNDVLEPLFYEALAVERTDDFYSRFNCKIPFLNGGLFDPINNYDWVHTDILLNNELFSNTDRTKEKDIGTGILDVFDRYNFTVKEDEPLDKEVAVDPEMLGKVFENLLEIKDRKSKGTYYTPREIVHYMCQESLINYLDTAINTGEVPLVATPPPQGKLFGKPDPEQSALKAPGYRAIVPREDIEALVRMGELAIEHDTRVESYGKETERYSYKLSQTIRWNAKLIDEKLAGIRVCDPAIGSGAFPVGLMTEIVRARNTLTTYLPDKEGRTNYNFKRHAIQNCLYGVDIDPGAVEIAKLRLWLSLVVDEEDIKQIQPLPNLDYKVVCGNSLLGVKKDILNWPFFEELEKLKPLYFNETNVKKKQACKNEIDQLITKLTNNSTTFDFKVYFSEVVHEKGGFDVVIANPPYIASYGRQAKRFNKEEIAFYIRNYKTFSKVSNRNNLSINTVMLFLEKGMDITRENGGVSYIIDQAFLNVDVYRYSRKYILDNSTLKEVVSDLQFPYVIAEACILFFGQQPQKGGSFSWKKGNPCSQATMVTVSSIIENDYRFSLSTYAEIIRKMEKNSSHLGEVAETFTGMQIIPEYFLSNDDNVLRLKKWHKAVFSNNIRQYRIIWPAKKQKGKYVTYDTDLQNRIRKELQKRLDRGERCRKPESLSIGSSEKEYRFDRPKIILSQTVHKSNQKIELQAALDEVGYYGNVSIHLVRHNDINYLKFLLAIMNSSLISFYAIDKKLILGTEVGSKKTPQIRKSAMDRIPIKMTQAENRKPFTELVDQILATTKDEDYLSNPAKQAKVKKLERQIDQMVYELYGLTSEEIVVVEGSSGKQIQ